MRLPISAIAPLQHLLTVTPVVAVLPNASAFLPKPNEDEVETVFSVPLSTFLEVSRTVHAPAAPIASSASLHSLPRAKCKPGSIIPSCHSVFRALTWYTPRQPFPVLVYPPTAPLPWLGTPSCSLCAATPLPSL